MMRGAVVLLLGIAAFNFLCEYSPAAINSVGDVNPVPPAGGGNITAVLRVGNTSLGIMEISGGTGLTQNTDALVGNTSDAIGYVTLSGVGSNWLLTQSSNDMTVGAAGLGTVSLEEFARVEVPGVTSVGSASTGVGEININGVGTIWEADTATIGVSGTGTVNITGGGRFATDSSTVGANNLSSGHVVVADPLSQWRVSGGITVGSSGYGRVSILDGGTLRTTTSSTLGSSLSGTGTVEIIGVGSVWNAVNGNVTVGSAGTGKLNVFDGGRATVEGNLQLAVAGGSRGDVWVDGLGSTLTVGGVVSGVGESQVTISEGGEVIVNSMTWSTTGRLNLRGGRLNVSGQGGFSSSGLISGSGVIETSTFTNAQLGPNRGRMQVATAEHLRVTNAMTNTGLVDLAGGELEVGGPLTNNFDIDARNGAVLRVGSTGLVNNSGAQFAVTAGEIDVFGAVENNTGAQILVANGASAVFHDTVTNNGDLIVLSGSTLLAVEQLSLLGDQSSLSFQLTVDDLFAETEPLNAAGTVVLGGELSVTLDGGYEPQPGDVFPLLASNAGLTGDFLGENLPGLGAGLDWELQRTPTSMSLVVVEVAGTPGDFDGDGDVDGRDFLAWQRDSNVGDLADWQANYGAGPLNAVSVVVPEPTAAVLVLWAVATALVQFPNRSVVYSIPWASIAK